MKNFKRRLISFIMVLTLILSLSTLLSGCYIIQSGKMDWIEGIYELTSYSGKTNYMENRGMKIIMVIRRDGTGWYGYQSNTVDPYITELRCRFTQDTEDPGKYSYVEIDFAGDGTYEKFGIQASRTSSTLSSSEPVWHSNPFDGIDYYITSSFKRIGKSTDIEKLKELFGDHPMMPRGSMKFDGTYEGFGLVTTENSPYGVSAPEDPFVYCYADVDFVTGAGKIWYMLKSDEQAQTKEFNVKIDSEMSNGFVLKLNDTAVRVEKQSYSGYMYIPITTDEGEFAIYLAYRGDSYTYEDITQSVAEIYNNYLTNKQN